MARNAARIEDAQGVTSELHRLYTEAAGCMDELLLRCSDGRVPGYEETVLFQDLVLQALAEARHLAMFASEFRAERPHAPAEAEAMEVNAPQPMRPRHRPARAA